MKARYGDIDHGSHCRVVRVAANTHRFAKTMSAVRTSGYMGLVPWWRTEKTKHPPVMAADAYSLVAR